MALALQRIPEAELYASRLYAANVDPLSYSFAAIELLCFTFEISERNPPWLPAEGKKGKKYHLGQLPTSHAITADVEDFVVIAYFHIAQSAKRKALSVLATLRSFSGREPLLLGGDWRDSSRVPPYTPRLGQEPHYLLSPPSPLPPQLLPPPHPPPPHHPFSHHHLPLSPRASLKSMR